MLKTIPIWPQCSINLTPILLPLFVSPVKGWQSSCLSCSDGWRSRGPLSALVLQLVCLCILKTCLTSVFPPHCLTTLTSQTCCYSEFRIPRIVSVFQASHAILTTSLSSSVSLVKSLHSYGLSLALHPPPWVSVTISWLGWCSHSLHSSCQLFLPQDCSSWSSLLRILSSFSLLVNKIWFHQPENQSSLTLYFFNF